MVQWAGFDLVPLVWDQSAALGQAANWAESMEEVEVGWLWVESMKFGAADH